jgi:hypothetical protein
MFSIQIAQLHVAGVVLPVILEPSYLGDDELLPAGIPIPNEQVALLPVVDRDDVVESVPLKFNPQR